MFHKHIRGRFNRGDPEVVQAMTDLAEITRQGREALLKWDEATLARLMDENFNIPRAIYKLPG